MGSHHSKYILLYRMVLFDVPFPSSPCEVFHVLNMLQYSFLNIMEFTARACSSVDWDNNNINTHAISSWLQKQMRNIRNTETLWRNINWIKIKNTEFPHWALKSNTVFKISAWKLIIPWWQNVLSMLIDS